MPIDPRERVASVVAGDVDAIAALESFGGALGEHVSGLTFTVTAIAVRHVLVLLATGARSAKVIQSWASFVRRGYVAGSRVRAPIVAIEIAYETGFEDTISEVIGRFDELGDLIDSELTQEELVAFSQRLEPAP